MGTTRGRREKGTEEIFKEMTENSLTSNNDAQMQEAREHQEKQIPKKLHLNISFSNYRKLKTREKLLKEVRDKNTLLIEE